MGFGLWKKIKNGLRKAGAWIRDNVVQPVSKIATKIVAPLAKYAAPLGAMINPALGAGLAGIGVGADLIGKVTQNPKDELVPLLKEGIQRFKR
jgi:hypothetical protein